MQPYSSTDSPEENGIRRSLKYSPEWTDERLLGYISLGEMIIFKTVATVLSNVTDIYSIAKACFGVHKAQIKIINY